MGGLIVEAGRGPGDSLAPLIARRPLPEAWRFVLVRPAHAAGLSGEAERAAFAALPPVPVALTNELCRLALLELLPAADAGDFVGFSQALFDYGRLAGRCFTADGQASFGSRTLERLIGQLRELGARGAGQSSWGPTLFALAPSQAAAESLEQDLRREVREPALTITIAKPNNHGAQYKAV